MHHFSHLSTYLRRLLFSLGTATLLLLSLWLMASADSVPLSKVGYLDFSYQGWSGSGVPTGEKPESKLWWNDGFWWAPLYNSAAGEFHIYRLNWGTQTWEDTGGVVDDRDNTKADVVWDGTANKLYIASHIAIQSDGEAVGNQANWARLYRYTYDPAAQTYSLDANFPVTINQDVSETLVMARDATGRLWITYVSRGETPSETADYRVFLNSSGDNGVTWDTPSVPTLDSDPNTIHVARGDIVAIVAFGSKVGIMWNNSSNQSLHFASHDAGSTSGAWVHQSVPVPVPEGADDHINIKSLQGTGDGRVFAAIKTNAKTADPIITVQPLIGMVARDTDGSFIFRQYSRNSDKDTRPILVIDEGDLGNTTDDKVYIFVAGKESGSKICYKTLAVKTPLSSMGDFPIGDCGTNFMEDNVYKAINNPTTMKQNANKITGIAVLASDDSVPTSTTTSRVYVHNVLGNPPPVVTDRGPQPGATDVLLSAVVTATFSKPMDPATINNSTFTLEDANGPVAGTPTYNISTRTATFTPAAMWQANTTYTATLTNGLKDTANQALNEGIDNGPVIERWSFSTASAAVQFAQTDYSVNEVDGSATITVVLNTQSSQVVTVSYATSDGTALAIGPTADYTATSGLLTFQPGELVKTFPVAIANDILLEGNETLNLALTDAGNASIGVPPTATLIIVDDDVSTVQFSPTSFSAPENSGQADVKVVLSRAANFTITVDYASSDDSAVAGSDYAAVSGTLTFAPGETQKTIPVPLLDDSLDEPDETVSLALSNPSPLTVTLGSPGGTAILTILDDDPTPTVRFTSETASVEEGAGTAPVAVTLSSASSFTVTVDYATGDSSAVAGSDYAATNGTLTFAPGQTSQSFPVPISEDSLDEADETFTLQLSNASHATLGVPANATLTIVDNDSAPTVQFGAATLTESENSDIIEIQVTLSAASGQVVTVDYASSNGTAVEGTDYAAANGTLTFAPGETSQTFEFKILDDTLDEADETVNLALSNASNAILGVPANATLTISDNDEPATGVKVQFNSATYSVNEGVASATILVSLNAVAPSAVTVNYATSNGTAVAGSDYTATSGTLTFAPGQTSQTFSVPISEDTAQEGSETVNLTLSNPGNAALGAPASATLTIIDDDGEPLVQFSSATYSVDEDAGTATIEVTLNKASAAPISVDYATSDGSAVAGSDYTATDGTLTFAPGQTSQSFSVPITDDNVDEPDETINLSLSNPSNAILGAQSNAILTIADGGSSGAPSIRFSSATATYSVDEDAGVATIQVTLDQAAAAAVSVDYATSDGTANAGSDYTATNGTLTFAPGETSQSFTVPISEDSLDEPDETITLTLSNPVNAVLSGQTTATLTIVDNDSTGGNAGGTVYLPLIQR